MNSISTAEFKKRVIDLINSAGGGRLEVLQAGLSDLERIADPSRPSHSTLLTILSALEDYYLSRTKESIKKLNRGLPPHTKWNDPDMEGLIYILRGSCLRSEGQLDLAVMDLNRAIELLNPVGLTPLYFDYALYQLGEIHRTMGEYEQAMEYLARALALRTKDSFSPARFRMRSAMALCYLELGQMDDCKRDLDEAEEQASSPMEVSRNLYDKALYHVQAGELDRASHYVQRSLHIRMDVKLEDAATTCRILWAEILNQQRRHEEALPIIEHALKDTQRFNAAVKQMDAHLQLAICLENLGDAYRAVKHYKAHIALKTEIETKQHKQILHYKNDILKREKEISEERRRELMDSIAYAKRIQAAILPPGKVVKEHLTESFVLYLPKDIVAGDFYWMETCADSVLFAAADCTGHGVPGAMVSVVCHNGLNRAVREYGLTDPGQILDKTREIVVEEFARSEENVKDGMDIALCRLEGNTLHFAGAHNPLWIVRGDKDIPDSRRLEEIKADKQPIGQFDHCTPFTTHSISLHPGDTIYIFSDGYVDQFGGPNDKKFKASRFKELLLSLHKEPMSRQKELIHQAFQDWRGENEQVDDVCVIGVRV